VLAQVAEQDPDHADREADIRRQVHYGNGSAALGQYVPVLRAQPYARRDLRAGRRDDDVGQSQRRPGRGHGPAPH
jgi:hypothetical protein